MPQIHPFSWIAGTDPHLTSDLPSSYPYLIFGEGPPVLPQWHSEAVFTGISKAGQALLPGVAMTAYNKYNGKSTLCGSLKSYGDRHCLTM